MKKITTNVTYRVPDWCYCNHSKLGRPLKDMCRFCTKHGSAYVCTLHNMPLVVEEGKLIRKDDACIKATYGAKSVVEDEISVDPAQLIKLTIKEYRKVYSKLTKDGYPDAMAHELALQHLSGGK